MGQCFIMRRWRIAASQPIVTQYLYGIPSANANIGLRSGDDVTLYYGTVLPKLPDWDTETYPYAFMEILTSGYIRFYVITSKVAKNTDGTLLIYATEDCRYKFYTQRNDNTWSESAELLLRAGDRMFHTTDGHEPIPIWANWDMMGTGNVLYLPASDPIQVSELVDAIDGMPIYMPVVPDVPESAMYLYGTPNIVGKGNIGLRSGDTVIYYDGLVLTDEVKTYPYVFVSRTNLPHLTEPDGRCWFHMVDTMLESYGSGQTNQYGNSYTVSPVGSSSAMQRSARLDIFGELGEPSGLTVLGGQTIVWSNYDHYHTNGNLLCAKSNPIPVSGIVGYSYNGIIRPPKPEYDETLYPYAFYDYIGNNYYACKSVSFGLHTNGNLTSKKIDLGEHKMWKYSFAEWANPSSDPDGIVLFTYIKWANFDVLNPSDNTVYLAASDPIPVYE